MVLTNLTIGKVKNGSMGDNQYHQEGHQKSGRKRFLRPIDEFLLTCMRLRLGLNQEHLADIFRISKTSVSRIFNTWVNFIYDHSKGLIAWHTREQIPANLPRYFNDHSDTRIVVDCTEFFCGKTILSCVSVVNLVRV